LNVEDLSLLEVFERCLKVGNENLILQYQNQFYKQARGLAMSVADSPDLANLYGAEFERLACVETDPLIPFYGRFIDDILAIVFATSEREAVKYMQNKVQFDNCEITWSASLHGQPFLDMFVYREFPSGKLQHKPFRKAGNHGERIPWTSGHPLQVKRGTFIGEMSRLATLSSTAEHYLEALDSLTSLYVKRGYPDNLVNKWRKDNVNERWVKRLVSRPAPNSDELLVLKSEYNEAWNYFNAKELGDIVLGYWRDYANKASAESPSLEDGTLFPRYTNSPGELPLDSEEFHSVFDTKTGPSRMFDIRKTNILNRRMIVSKKRTRNLFDLTSLWKKTILLRMEKETLENQQVVNPALEEPIVNVEDLDQVSYLGIDYKVGNIAGHRRSRSPDESALAHLANTSFNLGNTGVAE
jgi:hypothetical protein